MKRRPPKLILRRRPRPTCAFTVLELLLTMTILTVIIVALYAVFNQTQRALRGSMNQVDVLESGRAAMDLITRDLEQAVSADVDSINFASELFFQLSDATPNPTPQPIIQELAGTDKEGNPLLRTNLLGDVFFLTQSNNFWVGNAYFVLSPLTNRPASVTELGVGTLYRFSWVCSTNQPEHSTNWIPRQIAVANRQDLKKLYELCVTNRHVFNRDLRLRPTPIIDGVIHFRVVPEVSLSLTNGLSILRPDIQRSLDILPGQEKWLFLSNALPEAVEVELGILEPTTYDRLQAMPTPDAARDYLTNRAGRVHLFRQRIPLPVASR